MAKLTVVLVGCVLAITGCVSMPSSGPVRSYNITQGTSGTDQQYLQVDAVGPGNDWGPMQIVEGFLAANASFAQNHQVAREYLAGRESASWDPGWSATVFSGGAPDVSLTRESARTAVVTISGPVQASVGESGAYAVPQGARGSDSTSIQLVKADGQWRISSPPQNLLLSAVDFAADYQSRNLYFFDSSKSSLVADPVYAPLEAARADPTDLLAGLVRDLINQPQDWLSGGATTTAFPAGTKVTAVTLAGGTAAVYLTGAAATAKEAKEQAPQQITAQLLWTLSGSGNQPAVTSVELFLDGKVWTPPGAGNVPVQQQSSYSKYAPPNGGGPGDFYYLDSRGDVLEGAGPNGKPAKVYTALAKGPVLTDIAVSPDGKYLAGTSGGWVYTGKISGPLQRRVQSSVTSLSWDSSDQLWIAGAAGLEVLRGAAFTATPVTVWDPSDNKVVVMPVTALRVAPDGARVAMVLGGSELSFGAIIEQPGGVTIQQSPFSVNASDLTGLSWYGAADVIVLSGTGTASAAVEYPVNGDTPIKIQSVADMVNITASWGSPLIASFANGEMSYNESVSGAWISLNATGQSVVYPG